MLHVDSLDDIRYVDVNPESGRIYLVPNRISTLYRYESIPFCYEITPHIPEEFSHLPIPNMADYGARWSEVIYGFKDRNSGKIKNLSLVLVEVWNEVDEGFRDIFLMHELSEMKNKIIERQPKIISHEIAKKRTDDYIKRYLNPEEIEGFNRMMEILPERRKRKSDVMII